MPITRSDQRHTLSSVPPIKFHDLKKLIKKIKKRKISFRSSETEREVTKSSFNSNSYKYNYFQSLITISTLGEGSRRIHPIMSSPDIAVILETSKELDRLRKEEEDVLFEINKMHKKLQSTPEVVEKPGDNSLLRLKMLYTQAKELSESEVNISNQLLVQLDALIPSGPRQQRRRIGVCKNLEGNEQKKKRMKADSDILRLSPSMRNQLDALASLKGEQVAARVTQENAEKDEWFVVKVIHFDRETKEFEVLDEEPGDDEEGGGGQRKYKLPVSHIIPFPKQNDSTSAQDFPTGKQVLAVYPGTTALYRATVVQPRKTDEYVLEFDDDEEEDGSMPQRVVSFDRVVGLPEGHRQ
ncbi:unnamed protein product [Camellia sinensis]